MRYAALKAVIAIVLGIILAQYVSIINSYLFIVIILLLILSFSTKTYWLLYCVLLFSSTLNYNAYKAQQNQIENFPLYDTPVKIQAQINEISSTETNRYSAKLLKINNSPVSGKIFLYLKSTPSESSLVKEGLVLSYGNIIDLKSKITPFDFPRNPNLIDYNRYYHKQGYLGSLFIGSQDIDTIITSQGNWLMYNFVLPIRHYFFKTIDKYLDDDEKDLLIGMLLGEKRDMSMQLRATFADAGVAHILAVSGLHIGILIGLLLLFLPIIRIRKLPALIIICIVTIIYLALIGFKTSAVRAGLMITCASLGLFLERRYESINGVFFAGIIILLISPQVLTDIGFQLSFAATIAILLITPRLYDLIRDRKIPKFIKLYLLLPLLVSISASIGTAPIILYHFYQFPLLVVFANIIIIPLVSLALPLGFLVLLFNPFLPAIAGIYAQTLWLTLKSIIFISDKFANLHWQIIESGRPLVVLIILFYLVVLLMLFWNNLKFRKISLAILLIGINILIWQNAFRPKQLAIIFLDVKQGDAIFFEFPNGKKMLLDAGEENEIIPQFLKSNGIRNIDLAVITHPHLDHYGGYRNLINDINIKQFLIATDTSPDTMYTNLINAIKNSLTQISFANQGLTVHGLGAKIEVLSHDSTIKLIYHMQVLDPNDLSIVFKLTYNNISFLFPGDLNDTELMQDLPIQAQILKSPHHASKTANNKLLFDKVKPEYIIITGRKKINPDVLTLIEQYKIKAFNTRKDGALAITIGNHKLNLKHY
jgi:competence protein ComEC